MYGAGIFKFVHLPQVSRPGVMARRPIPRATREGWISLAAVFENLLGGSAASRQAANYLRSLAADSLPLHPLHPLPWHSEVGLPDVILAREEPHPCVLAVLCPSVPLRAVWRRNIPRPNQGDP